MDSIKNSANFELCFIYFYEKYAWFTMGVPQSRDVSFVLDIV